MINENLKQMYSDLQREYDLILDRRKNLTSQAQNLMSFAGIIQTVLVGLVVALSTNKDAHNFIVSSPHYSIFLILAGIGFISYIVTVVFSLIAFREPQWMRVPQIPNPVDHFIQNPDDYDIGMFARQLSEANNNHMDTNSKKYHYLNLATVSLMVGIIATILFGFVILITTR